MREFVDKEVGYLAHFLRVVSVSIPTLSTKVRHSLWLYILELYAILILILQ